MTLQIIYSISAIGTFLVHLITKNYDEDVRARDMLGNNVYYSTLVFFVFCPLVNSIFFICNLFIISIHLLNKNRKL